jgi:hypothetical protein
VAQGVGAFAAYARCRRWRRDRRRQEADARAPVRRKLFAAEAGVVMMTDVRGVSNAKAKRELGWRPAHRSWRQGFAAA